MGGRHQGAGLHERHRRPETNRINQLVVEPTLQTTRDPNIFAIGDCASCPKEGGGFVPPRAQSAHQMASRCATNILALMNGQTLKPYVYKDHGSLVSLSRFSTVGSLMGNLMRGSMMVEGRIARFVYISLYRMHRGAARLHQNRPDDAGRRHQPGDPPASENALILPSSTNPRRFARAGFFMAARGERRRLFDSSA